MRAVFRHEIKSCFSSIMTYVFGAFLLVFAGLYTVIYNLKNMLVNFEYVLSNMSFAFLIIVPVLTMRILAEERKQKTDQLLYSLPISMTQVILGKFFALLTVMAVPVGIISLYPLILSAYGNVYLPAVYGSVVGFFLLGAALIAIGIFISSLTESQPVAAGLCFVVMLLNYYLSTVAAYADTSALSSLGVLTLLVVLMAVIVRRMTKNTFTAIIAGMVVEAAILIGYIVNASAFEGLIPKIMEKLSVFDRFYVFVYGVFDVTGLVYLLTVIGIFLFLSVQSMEKRRWSE